MPDRLSALDASLLSMEDTTTPMHVGTVAVFSRPKAGFDYEGLVDLVERRLALVPRYRQVVRDVPGRIARPVWIDDENFDIAYHVRRSALPKPGTDAQLAELVARLMSRRLDRQRPLWEAYLVDGLEGNRIAVVTKSHNALVNGVDGVDIGQAISDGAPKVHDEREQLWMPRPVPGAARLITDAVGDVATETLHDVLSGPFGLVRRLRGSTGVSTLLGDVLDAAVSATRSAVGQGSRLNVRISGQRLFASVHTEQARYQRIATAAGCADAAVVLAVLAGALRGWQLSHGDAVTEGAAVRALVPNGNAAQLVELPVGEPDPMVRLQHIAYQLRTSAESTTELAVDVVRRAGELAPPTLHALGARVASMYSKHLFNIVVTDVRGSDAPSYVAGARLTELYPVVPLLRNHALAIGVSRFAGSVCFGCNADRIALSDVDTVAAMITEALDELESIAETMKDVVAT